MVKKSETKKEGTTIPIRNVSRLLPVKLTEVELMQTGQDLAATVQDIASEEDRQKGIKDQLKVRMSELVAKETKLALLISRKEEYREVTVKIEIRESGQVSETRVDTGEVLILREAHEDERQLPLAKQEEPKSQVA